MTHNPSTLVLPKITAGLGSIDDYPAFVSAGADELFIGYVPEEWQLRFGLSHSLNRREVFYYNVQIGSESELDILADMISAYGVPVTIALNSFHFLPEHYPVIAEIAASCMKKGFHSFIAADPELMRFLYHHFKANAFPAGDSLRIHVSGETGEINSPAIREYLSLGASRIIFHRKTGLNNMKACISAVHSDPAATSLQQLSFADDAPEYEAFILNELCHFHGGWCNSYHCDELTHMCRVPYHAAPMELKKNTSLCPEHTVPPEVNPYALSDPDAFEAYLPGRSGCGLCSLYELAGMGITHLKLVSRGNYAEDTLNDIRTLRTAIRLAGEARSKEEYISTLMHTIFPNGCSGNCYYPE